LSEGKPKNGKPDRGAVNGVGRGGGVNA
jgi:hypothetical protein